MLIEFSFFLYIFTIFYLLESFNLVSKGINMDVTNGTSFKSWTEFQVITVRVLWLFKTLQLKKPKNYEKDGGGKNKKEDQKRNNLAQNFSLHSPLKIVQTSLLKLSTYKTQPEAKGAMWKQHKEMELSTRSGERSWRAAQPRAGHSPPPARRPPFTSLAVTPTLVFAKYIHSQIKSIFC